MRPNHWSARSPRNAASNWRGRLGLQHTPHATFAGPQYPYGFIFMLPSPRRQACEKVGNTALRLKLTDMNDLARACRLPEPRGAVGKLRSPGPERWTIRNSDTPIPRTASAMSAELTTTTSALARMIRCRTPIRRGRRVIRNSNGLRNKTARSVTAIKLPPPKSVTIFIANRRADCAGATSSASPRILVTAISVIGIAIATRVSFLYGPVSPAFRRPAAPLRSAALRNIDAAQRNAKPSGGLRFVPK